MKETQRLMMFRSRQSALNKSTYTDPGSSWKCQGKPEDIEKLAKSLAGKKKR